MPSDSDGTTASPDLTEDEGSTTADDSNSDSESDATSSNASEQDGAEASAELQPSARPSLKAIIGGVGAVVLLALVGVAIYLGNRTPSSNGSATTSAPTSQLESSIGVSSTSTSVPGSRVSVCTSSQTGETGSSTGDLQPGKTGSSSTTESQTASINGSQAASSATVGAPTGLPTILRITGSHTNYYAAQGAQVIQFSQRFPPGKYWITNTATAQCMTIKHASFYPGAVNHTANIYLAPRAQSAPINLTWSTNPLWVADARFSNGDDTTATSNCASAQWESQIAGFNRVAAAYSCSSDLADGNEKQSWAIVKIEDAKNIVTKAPSSRDSTVTNMPTDIYTANMVQQRGLPALPGEKRGQYEKRESTAPDPSQQFMIISDAHLTDMVTTVMLGANYSAWNAELGIALTDFDPQDPWQYWTFEQA